MSFRIVGPSTNDLFARQVGQSHDPFYNYFRADQRARYIQSGLAVKRQPMHSNKSSPSEELRAVSYDFYFLELRQVRVFELFN